MKSKSEIKNFVIAHPMDSFHPGQGGGIRYLMNVLVSMKNLGWEPTVIGVELEKTVSDKEEWHQIALVEERSGRSIFRKIPVWVKYLAKLYITLPFTLIPKDAVILTHRIDCMLAFVLFKWKHPKVLITAAPGHYLRISHPHFYRFFGWVYHLAERVCIQGIHAIIPTDEKTRSYFLKRYPNSRLVENIPSSIDLTNFKLTSKEQARNSLHLGLQDPVVLFSGRLAAVKNIPLLIRAFSQIPQHYPNARLVLVGDGEERDKIKALAAESSRQIKLIGRVDPAEMYKYYAASDLLVLCSLEEGSPTVVKEALACGTPVVSTNVGDVAELLSSDPILGCIVASDDVSLSRAIISYLDVTDSLEQRKRRNRVAGKFDIQLLGKKFEMIFIQAASISKRIKGN